MAGMSGGSMLRTRRKDVNIKPNRRLDRKSSRGMLYENEELRLRTININAEVERGQTDIKKLKRENEQLRREVGALRGEYDRLERLLHQRQDKESPERQDDEKTSIESYCSDCESECCVQNEANTAWDCHPCHPCYPCETGNQAAPCCGGRGGEPLSSVPEETIAPRGPPGKRQGFPPCRCQTTPSELKPTNCGFSTTSSPVKEFFTAVVTVPLSCHLPSTPTVSLAPAVVFPKSGLDILINNNTFENFEGFTIAPPIGFIIPPPPNHEPTDEEPFQIVPNVEFASEPTNFKDIKPSEDIPCENFDFNNQIIPFNPDTGTFPNGGTLEDLLGDLDSVSSSGDFVKDSIFVCKTRKVIQQLTTVQNTSVNTGTNQCRCNCKCNNVTEIANAPDVVVVDSNSDGSQFFRTEKNIELDYDYPKTVLNCASGGNAFADSENTIDQEVLKNVDLTQTTHTTTEVNSTVMMIERKKNPLKGKNKFPIFGRSNSAPVETITDEPIYATVKKLPKKLQRLNIRNLENEIRYIPPPDTCEDVKIESKSIEPATEICDQKTKEETIKEVASKTNGAAYKSNLKSDSLSESSEKGNQIQTITVIPKSPLVRKKKRFSIRFKRKNSKNKTKNSIKEETVEQNELQILSGEKFDADVKSSESDKLIDASSSPDTPDTVKFKEHPPVFCKKHGKPKLCREGHRVHGQGQKPHRDEGYPHNCLHKRGSIRSNDLTLKKGFHPSKSYFKQDSFQEMTTSHSERERTNSLSSSGHSGFSLGSAKPRSVSNSRREGNIPWCGCWGNSCL